MSYLRGTGLPYTSIQSTREAPLVPSRSFQKFHHEIPTNCKFPEVHRDHGRKDGRAEDTGRAGELIRDNRSGRLWVH